MSGGRKCGLGSLKLLISLFFGNVWYKYLAKRLNVFNIVFFIQAGDWGLRWNKHHHGSDQHFKAHMMKINTNVYEKNK